MGFLSLEYGAFLLILATVYWLIPHLQARLLILLTASLLFYSSLQVQFVWLLLASTGLNFWLGLQIKQSSVRLKGWLLGLGIGVNLLLLLSFKYIPFLSTTISNVFNWQFGNTIAAWASQHIAAPISISFFSFEMIAYLIDIYRGASPSRNFLNFATYKTFFAKLLSGPIVRYQEFAPQLVSRSHPLAENIVEGLWLIACGAVKKGILADNLGRLVDLNFGNLDRAGSIDLWLALFAYALQIYFDFSGYVDVARGSALILGFKLPKNFDFPYLSASISEFWRRWNITLGNWLRDYVYIPLGGSRRGLLLTCVNLAIVMLVAGIWHGANWGFVIWGLWHGLALALHRLMMTVSLQWRWLGVAWKTWPGQILAIAITQSIVLLGWIPFRLPNLIEARLMWQGLWGKAADPQFGLKIYVESLGLTAGQIGLLIGGLVTLMIVAYQCDRAKWQLTWTTKLFFIPLCLYLVALLGPQKNLPFIYFDF